MGICDGCHAGCCRTFAVPVTGADIFRIQRATGLSFWDFVCRWADPKGTIARGAAPHFHFSDDPTTPFVIALLHVPSRVFAGTTRCCFLEETPPDAQHPLGQGRCLVYPVRPLACRAFPTRLDSSGELAVIQEVPSHARDERVAVYRLCPRPWQPDDLDPVETPLDLAAVQYEMNFFRAVAAVWNRKPQSWLAFPDFLQYVYSRRVVTAEQVSRLDDVSDQPQPESSAEPVVLPLTTRPATPQSRAA